MGRALWLPDVLRDAGLPISVHPGFERCGRGDLDERVGIQHHTGSQRVSAARPHATLSVLVHGRAATAEFPRLAGPLCNWSTGVDGTIIVIASGTANHAGAFKTGKAQTKYRATSNAHTLGDEAENDGRRTRWPELQLENMARAWAAVFDHKGWETDRLFGHKEWAPGRKPDPEFAVPKLTMDQFRVKIDDFRESGLRRRIPVSLLIGIVPTAELRNAIRHQQKLDLLEIFDLVKKTMPTEDEYFRWWDQMQAAIDADVASADKGYAETVKVRNALVDELAPLFITKN